MDLESPHVDINVITGLIKSYFRELEEPLIPFDFYTLFIDAIGKIQILTIKNMKDPNY